jgi:hypothetical protein
MLHRRVALAHGLKARGKVALRADEAVRKGEKERKEREFVT